MALKKLLIITGRLPEMDKELYGDLVSEADTEGINRYVVGAVIVKNSRVLLLQ